MLTIKQLADYVGVTIKTVRHYHRIGLLAEPARDEHGYRRYGAQSLIDLQRIRVLAESGVPLARVRELLDADRDELRVAQEEIDAQLGARIRELEHARHRLRALVEEDEPSLPEGPRRLVRRLRQLGVPDEVWRLNRDGWLLASVVFPGQVDEWALLQEQCLADEHYLRLFRLTIEARGWDPDDPRLVDLADTSAAWIRAHGLDGPVMDTVSDKRGFRILSAFGRETPSQLRLARLIREHLGG